MNCVNLHGYLTLLKSASIPKLVPFRISTCVWGLKIMQQLRFRASMPNRWHLLGVWFLFRNQVSCRNFRIMFNCEIRESNCHAHWPRLVTIWRFWDENQSIFIRMAMSMNVKCSFFLAFMDSIHKISVRWCEIGCYPTTNVLQDHDRHQENAAILNHNKVNNHISVCFNVDILLC